MAKNLHGVHGEGRIRLGAASKLGENSSEPLISVCHIGFVKENQKFIRPLLADS